LFHTCPNLELFLTSGTNHLFRDVRRDRDSALLCTFLLLANSRNSAGDIAKLLLQQGCGVLVTRCTNRSDTEVTTLQLGQDTVLAIHV